MSKALALRTEYRLQHWAKIAKECAESGMTNVSFCTSKGISDKTYYYWLRRLREAAAESMPPQLVEVKLSKTSKSGILNVRYQEADLMVTKETSPELLLSTLRVLKQL
jgi:transposase-like protein